MKIFIAHLLLIGGNEIAFATNSYQDCVKERNLFIKNKEIEIVLIDCEEKTEVIL